MDHRPSRTSTPISARSIGGEETLNHSLIGGRGVDHSFGATATPIQRMGGDQVLSESRCSKMDISGSSYMEKFEREDDFKENVNPQVYLQISVNR